MEDHPLFVGTDSLIKIYKSSPPVQKDTFVHIHHVVQRVRQIGLVMKLEPYQLDVLQFAARLHDIAKFLKKFRWLFFEHSSEFSTEEREEANKHAYASAQTVQELWDQGRLGNFDFDVVAPAIFIIAGHHWPYFESEFRYNNLVHRVNDKGEPDPEPQFRHAAEFCKGLGDFPLNAGRLLKVADHFEGRTENRHYLNGKLPLTQKQSLTEVRASVGVRFDPDVVEALQEVLFVSQPNIFEV